MFLCFKQVDTNDDMSLQLEEFKDYCKILGFADSKKMGEVFKLLDEDYSGTISLFEFT